MHEAAVADTIVALSSGRPPSAIAVIRTSGPRAMAAAAVVGGKLPAPRRASLRSLRDAAGALLDRALVIAFPGPDTSTGEDIVEYQCHGSKAVVAAVINALLAQPGVRHAEPGEFTRRALGNGRIDLTQAEGLAELLEAETESQRRSALLRAEGELRRRIEAWRSVLLTLSAEAEVAIDYADEEDGGLAFEPRARLSQLAADSEELLAAPRVERIRDGVRVVVAGPPNAGKSSLVNALAGESRAIVTAIPGTTRDLIEISLSLGGAALTLIDTAGLRETDDEVEGIGIGLAERAIDRADMLLWLGPPEAMPSHPVAQCVASKADIVIPIAGMPVSVVTGAGLDSLREWIVDQATTIVPHSEQPGLTEREADLVAACRDAVTRAAVLEDPVLVAEELRIARGALDHLTGLSGVDALLDALFCRFCLGK